MFIDLRVSYLTTVKYIKHNTHNTFTYVKKKKNIPQLELLLKK